MRNSLMLDIKQVEIAEKELEDMLKDNLHLIEEGLKFIDNQIVAGRGPLDILAVDNGGSLVVMELKVVESDDMLVQALDYYDWTLEHIDSVKRMYPRFNVDYEQSPRLILVAPSFSQTLLRRAVYLTISPELFTFKCLETEGKRGLLLEAVNLPPPPLPPPSPKSKQDFIDYVTAATVRDLLKIACDELCDLSGDVGDVEQYTTQTYIGYRIKGKKVFAILYPRRSAFWIETNDEEGDWKGYKIQTEDDYRRVLSNVKRTYKASGGQAALEEEAIAEKGAF
jgi:hypothetical protein